MTNQLNPPYVPSEAQLLGAIQVIIDNRRHAQNVIRWNKFRAFVFIAIALLATIAAAVHTKQVSSGNAIVFSAAVASRLLPGIILLVAPLTLWSHASSFPGTNSRNASWHLGLGHGEAASLLTVITMENEALKLELRQVDWSGLICSCTCILCTFQFVAAGFMILHP